MPKNLYGLLVAAAVVVLSAQSSSAETKPDFQGIFVMPPQQQGEELSCGRDNNDGAMKIHARSIDMYEHQCDIASLRPLKSDPRSAEARLSCSGEGNKWTTRELWNLQQVESRTMLIRTQLQLTETQFEGKRKQGKIRNDVHTTLYVKCPEQPSQ